jgi:5-methylcytosine-specific restriction protein A
MTIEVNILQKSFLAFSDFIKNQDGQAFRTFADSEFIDSQENYKYSVYKEAKENLGNKFWKPEDIGTGKIQKAVSSAIQTRVNHNYQMVANNLIDWRKKDDFKKLPKKNTLESLLFDFYKSKRNDSDCFHGFIEEGLSYQFVAYLYFVKDYQRFMPISQSRFDAIFEILGVDDYKTSGNASWDNYTTFLDLIKQTRDFLKTKDKNTTLLDAHTFLWILGQIPTYIKESIVSKPTTQTIENIEIKNEVVERLKIKPSNATELSVSEWTEILLDNELTKEFDLSIFQALYSFQDQKAYASQVALILETTHPPLNLEIGRYAKRIASKYDINFTERSEKQFKFWDLFFNGWDEGTKFIWQLRPELKNALEKTNLTGDFSYPEELPEVVEMEFYEGLKKTVIVNSYERNSKARELCVKHWKAICVICDFDFEKAYGEIGKGFIHVHHLTPVAQIGKTYQVDPIKDLIPVCPNCHSIIHKKEPPYSIEEMKKMLKKEQFDGDKQNNNPIPLRTLLKS